MEASWTVIRAISLKESLAVNLEYTHFAGWSITLKLTFGLTGLDSAKHVYFLSILTQQS